MSAWASSGQGDRVNVPESEQITAPEATEAESLIGEALAALARAQSTVESLRVDRYTSQPSNGESRSILPLDQARYMLRVLLAEGARRVDYVRPATDPALSDRPSPAIGVHVRELMVRPGFLPTPDENVEIRATRAELPEVAIVDESIAVIPARPTATAVPSTVAVLRDELVVAQLARFFEAAWGHAALPPLREPVLKAPDSEIKARIVRMLADGVKDEAAARRLGISLRTCRKHVAEILEELDSSSRFQAGLRAGLAGMVPERWPS